MPRAEYPVHPGIKVNGIVYKRVIIDGHYKVKHAPPMTDALIVTLCHLVSGEDIPIDDVRDSFVFMVVEKLPYLHRVYKLIRWSIKMMTFSGW